MQDLTEKFFKELMHRHDCTVPCFKHVELQIN